MNGKTILLVEDNKKILDFNRQLLEGRGFVIRTAVTLAEAVSSVKNDPPDAVVLDIGMPDGSGLDFLLELRQGKIKNAGNPALAKQISRTPVLLLTNNSEAEDIVSGFKSGCDDYLAKPYTFEVLLVRLQRLLQSAEQIPETVTRGSLTLKYTQREAYINGKNLLLTPKDFALLQFFIQNENRLLSAQQLYETVWGQPMAGDSRALENAVSRLRRKLKDCGYSVSTEYGTGYRFERGR